MIAFDALKFTFKNFGKLLPYYITPYLLVTIACALGFSPLFVKPASGGVLVLAIIGLIMLLAFFWNYIVKSVGVYTLINSLISTEVALPFGDVDANIKERSGKFIKFLLMYALISIVIAFAYVIPFVLYKVLNNYLLAALAVIFVSVFIVWIFVRLTFAYPAFVFNDFDNSMEPIKYSYKLSEGKAWKIFWELFVFSLILQIGIALIAYILGSILSAIILVKSETVIDILNNFISSLIYFTAFPVIITMLYREYNGAFSHPYCIIFENPEES